MPYLRLTDVCLWHPGKLTKQYLKYSPMYLSSVRFWRKQLFSQHTSNNSLQCHLLLHPSLSKVHRFLLSERNKTWFDSSEYFFNFFTNWGNKKSITFYWLCTIHPAPCEPYSFNNKTPQSSTSPPEFASLLPPCLWFPSKSHFLVFWPMSCLCWDSRLQYPSFWSYSG